MADMTLADLAAETLVQKNRRLRQAKCRHDEDGAVAACGYSGPEACFTDYVCFDCGKHWRVDHRTFITQTQEN